MRSFAVVAVFSLALFGCGSGDESAETDKKTGSGKAAVAKGGKTGKITAGDRAFSFTTKTCMTDGEDTLINGPGKEEGGDVVWVDLDSTAADEGELRLDLGIDEEFKSSDDILVLQENFKVSKSGDAVTVTGDFTDNEGGRTPGSMTVNCG